MRDCCDHKLDELADLRLGQAKILKVALGINALMFVLEFATGWFSHSTALLGDSLDMLGDAFVYAMSLYVIGKNTKWRASVSLIKGGIMSAFGLGVLIEAARRFVSPELPVASAMGVMGALALVANGTCAYLLLRHKDDDVNMRSTWLCSRNDVIANLGVLLAAGAVSLTQSKVPDLIVGICI
ncbi:cation transporter, partial [bacterium]|nr:cation transporter [bacterium]